MGSKHWWVGWVLSVLITGAGGPAMAAPPWQTLPPTPELPKGTVGHHATIRGARIWYAEWGRAAHPIPVLLLHGGFASSDYYGNLIPFLVENGYRVIAMDSRGHGRSTRADAPLTYHAMAEDVVGLLDTLKIPRVNVVGVSDGGIIGFDLEITSQNRIAGLFAFGANSDVSGGNDDGVNTPVFAAYLVRTKEEYARLSPTPTEWDGFQTALLHMWSTLPDYSAAQLRSIKVRTTIADGEHDEVIKSEHTKYLAATIPGARLVILPNVSHFAMLQDPAAFNQAVLDFLAR